MNKRTMFIILAGFLLIAGFVTPSLTQEQGIRSITAGELYTHLSFIAADELHGRNTPSPELKIAARYLASQVAAYGFEPLMPDGSYFQSMPLERIAVSPAQTVMKVYSPSGDRVFTFPKDFSAGYQAEGIYYGGVVFLGFGLSAPDLQWDDVGDMDISGKIAVVLDGRLPEDHPVNSRENRMALYRKIMTLRQKGALGVLQVISPEQEEQMKSGGEVFPAEAYNRATWQTGRGRGARSSPQPFFTGAIRHGAAAAILGISEPELAQMFMMLEMGVQVPAREIENKKVDIQVAVKRSENHTQNVVAYLEGSDPVLRNEYVCIGAHYDHVGARNGQVYNGADDDGSGTVAMLEIAQALSVERPKRSIILVWHAGEEKGLWGSRYFTQNCPVSLGKISAQLQMDMISRNATDSIYVIGTHFLSSELDQINKETAARLNTINLNNHYNFNNPNNDRSLPNNYFRQSDHYPYHQMGIPVIFYFTGVHEDLHRPTDTIEKCDFDKMMRVTQLVYAVAMEIGNRDALLKLDVVPEVTSRGKHNLKRRF